MLAYLPARRGRIEEAIEVLNNGMRADEMEGYDEAFHWWKLGVRGGMHHHLKHYDMADADLRKAIKTGVDANDSNTAAAWWRLITSLIARGKLAAAETELADYKTFVERVYPKHIDGYWVGRGWLELARGNAEEACSNFEQAHQVMDNLFAVKFGLGVAYLKAERVEEAIRELEIVTRGTHWSERMSPVGSVKAHYALGQAYETAGRPEDAAAQYEIFLTTFKDADPVFDEMIDAQAKMEHLRPGS
jgi:tetratricopeptide (TPR) repeat protein